MENVIHMELCKKVKFNHSTKQFMHKPESVLKNETHKILWHFELKMDHLISARKPDLVLITKKKTCRRVDVAVLADHRV